MKLREAHLLVFHALDIVRRDDVQIVERGLLNFQVRRRRRQD